MENVQKWCIENGKAMKETEVQGGDCSDQMNALIVELLADPTVTDDELIKIMLTWLKSSGQFNLRPTPDKMSMFDTFYKRVGRKIIDASDKNNFFIPYSTTEQV
jgi:hypothetical protein